jgi:hypothetical protein
VQARNVVAMAFGRELLLLSIIDPITDAEK